jgi:hypothetical protein
VEVGWVDARECGVARLCASRSSDA